MIIGENVDKLLQLPKWWHPDENAGKYLDGKKSRIRGDDGFGYAWAESEAKKEKRR